MNARESILRQEIKELMADVRIYTQRDYTFKMVNLLKDLIPHLDLVGLMKAKEELEKIAEKAL
ncbi:hypothetical protein [Virgibacillus halodenitrificans]|uniref:hypothetical protein n=1 Tax=Virgibacillus halodenitrificans TaxID=1482 RepID=UPI000EF548C3|nr:hypothetical protein [Virgibacillus halodenitrificans]